MKRFFLLLVPLAAFAAAPSADWSPNFTGTVLWQNNLTNGEAGWDRIGALQLTGDVVASSRYDFTRSDAFGLTAHGGGDWVPRFDRLARGLIGARADWQHAFGSDALAPVFTVEGGTDYIGAFEKARRGFDSALTLRLSKRFAQTWRAALTERFDQYDAQHHVFDSRSSETAVEVGRDINDATRLTVTARYRDGDVVTYARYQRPDLVAIARAYESTTTFHERMTAYSTQAKTLAGRVALVHATAEDTALQLAYEYAQTRRTDLKFANQMISLSWVRQY